MKSIEILRIIMIVGLVAVVVWLAWVAQTHGVIPAIEILPENMTIQEYLSGMVAKPQ